MGRIGEALGRARGEGRAALVVYVCAGDPDLETTPRLVAAAAEAGADVVELGVPFSDPTADGPAIQRASERALARGTSLRGVLAAVQEARSLTDVPVLLFGYYNPILAYGETQLVTDAARAGVDGLLVVDLPPEECEPLRGPAVARGLDFVPLVAPTSNRWRVELAASTATAFIYYVSTTGVTGAQGTDIGAAAERARAVAADTGLPVALGFGIKTPDDVALAASKVDAVVVGTAVVRAIEQAGGAEQAVAAVRGLVSRLAAAARRHG